MRAAAYCRVSTGNSAQLDSFEAQKDFFIRYCRHCGHELVQIYGDEGKSGTKMQSRPQLLRLLHDAELHIFDIVLVKDVSRLARNVLDFLSAMRTLKALAIKVVFVNSDLSADDGNEFLLTILSAVAQEESAGLSRRIKFGKKVSAYKGRVPNRVFGYARIDRYTLVPEKTQSQTVRFIFHSYTESGQSLASVSNILNSKKITTVNGCPFTPKAVSRILHNPLYTGRIVCQKTEVIDYLSGKRRTVPPSETICTYREELRLISDDLYEQAQKKAQRNNRRA